MHVSFIAYGHRQWLEWTLREMEAQKFPITLKFGKRQKIDSLQGAIRILPGGIYEYVFPKEGRDMVLTTLNFHKNNTANAYGMSKLKIAAIRKMIGHKKVKPFNTEKKLDWHMKYVSIIPIGEKYDGEKRLLKAKIQEFGDKINLRIIFIDNSEELLFIIKSIIEQNEIKNQENN